MAMEERFTDRQETGKDHEKLPALQYAGDMQTYLARFNELNCRVQLSGQALIRVITTAITPDIYRNIWRKYGKLPDTEADVLHAVREVGNRGGRVSTSAVSQETDRLSPEREGKGS